MNNESMINLRDEFIDYVGGTGFEKFVHALDNPMERTMFWQEQLWKRFTCDKNLTISPSWEELIKIFETDINKLMPDFKKKHTPIAAGCDYCNVAIEEGEGFIFYSSACFAFGDKVGNIEIGNNMFLCKSCTDNIVSEKGYTKQVPQQQELTPDTIGDTAKMLEMMNEANAASIVEHCKRHRLTPEEARAKAHQFALLWWENKEKAQIEAASFWKSASLPEPKKKWWQFWK